MKFQKLLNLEIEKSITTDRTRYFFNYKKGKKIINEYRQNTYDGTKFGLIFIMYINEEINRIRDYYQKKYNELLQSTINEENHERIKDMQNKFIQLKDYLYLNFVALGKITKKHDKNIKSNKIRDFYMSDNNKDEYNNKYYFKVIMNTKEFALIINDKLHKNKEKKILNNNIKQQNKNEFSRKTIKYLYDPINHDKILQHFLYHLPINKYKDTFIFEQPITSIYYDNDTLKLYHDRLERKYGAYLIRLRWYGNDVPKTLYYEKKIHTNEDIDSSSIKIRTEVFNERNDYYEQTINVINTINANNLKSENTDTSDIKNDIKVDETHTEISKDMITNNLIPKIRVLYNRTALEDPLKGIRVTIDTNLRFQTQVINDNKINIKNNNPIEVFAYNILEVKEEIEEVGIKTSKIVEELINKKLIIEMPKFSKYIHGCQLFNSTHIKPYWYNMTNNLNINTDNLAEKIMETDKLNNEIAIPLSDSYKLLQTNESLFAKWTSFTEKLLFASYALISEKNNRNFFIGTIILLFCIFIHGYNYYQYKSERMLIIKKRIKVLEEKWYGNITFVFINIILLYVCYNYAINYLLVI